MRDSLSVGHDTVIGLIHSTFIILPSNNSNILIRCDHKRPFGRGIILKKDNCINIPEDRVGGRRECEETGKCLPFPQEKSRSTREGEICFHYSTIICYTEVITTVAMYFFRLNKIGKIHNKRGK